jgi:hypothetical protein
LWSAAWLIQHLRRNPCYLFRDVLRDGREDKCRYLDSE